MLFIGFVLFVRDRYQIFLMDLLTKGVRRLFSDKGNGGHCVDLKGIFP
jgi:hypothetical protein